ncbi:MAG TPA: class I SAM-dependent methyltransferase [Epulopiscium sp.]|nr:class I SAM-dependent methyltransferase [Candidatus Epulonipiscium sp.]
MQSYGDFAQVYDLFMQEVPYEEWAQHIEQVWKKYNITPKLIAELGCGTGELTNYFASRKIDVIGIDNSDQMLAIAKEKSAAKGLDVLYLLQDMQEFELYGTVDSIYSACDSINYIIEDAELLQTFKWVNNYLEPGGIFIFDINTQYKYEEILAQNTFAYNIEEASYIWENYYEKEEQINEYLVTFFVKEDDDRYTKFEELHHERMYTLETITRLLEQAGMGIEGVFDGYTFNPVRENSDRITIIAREQGKERAE